MVFARNAVDRAAHADDDVAQGAVIHIDNAGEDDAARVNFQCVALLHVVVNHGAQQIVCRADGVHIAGEVQVDVLHRDDLCVTAACGAALDAEYRTERRLTQGNDGVFAHLVQRLAETNSCCCFAFSCRCRVDGGDENQFAVRLVLQALPCVIGDFCLILAVVFQLILQKSCLFGNFADGKHRTVLRNFNITQHIQKLL